MSILFPSARQVKPTNFWKHPLVGDTVMECYSVFGHVYWRPARGNLTTYTLPQPKHWLRWLILATAIGALGAAMLSYLGF